MSILRKFKRKKQIKEKNIKRKAAEKKLQEQATMFDKLPEGCSICKTPFDKQNREHAMTWRVFINNKEKRVSLFCPNCYQEAEEKNEKRDSNTGQTQTKN
jgi:hypothetical protein